MGSDFQLYLKQHTVCLHGDMLFIEKQPFPQQREEIVNGQGILLPPVKV